MTTYFISGHLDLNAEEFSLHYTPKIDAALENNANFVVGDAKGTDHLAQKYLQGKTTEVVVFHMLTSPRHNEGFSTRGGFTSDSERDSAMTATSDIDIAWVRPGRENSGTQKNLNRRKSKL